MFIVQGVNTLRRCRASKHPKLACYGTVFSSHNPAGRRQIYPQTIQFATYLARGLITGVAEVTESTHNGNASRDGDAQRASAVGSIPPSPVRSAQEEALVNDLDNDDDFAEKEAYAATHSTWEIGPSDAPRLTRPAQPSAVRSSIDDLLGKFLPKYANKKKLDLSHSDPIALEDYGWKYSEPATSSFRSKTPLRKILLDYVRDIEPLLKDEHLPAETSEADDRLARALGKTFGPEALKALQPYQVADVVSWAWVFTSSTTDLAISRYTALAKQLHSSKSRPVPKFVLLQLLRAHDISAFSLKKLIENTLRELRLCEEAKNYSGWGWTTRVCLVVRLLRHARRVSPECLSDVSLIVQHLFASFYNLTCSRVGQPELLRLTHVFNRFLSLIALTTAKAPFNAYNFQQDAQLALVRFMAAFEPQLPLTREGYRALISVQLLHRKTGPERAWADTKSSSWPPWRSIKSGIEQDVEYPGKDSRVIRLLRRMNEAGYSHGTWEQRAAILAGWDTDKSPTIQTRAILMRQKRPWLLSSSAGDKPGRAANNSESDPDLWATRIRATRSKREAWASFCAYEKSTDMSERRYQPYFVMLDRLLAKTAHQESLLGSEYAPGDVKEVFEDSRYSRDLIYVQTDVPSVDEFYDQMLREGFKPAGQLLSSLLDYALDIESGLSYIQDGRLSEVTKDVLRYPNKYPRTIIRDALTRIPIHSLASFVHLLCRYGYDRRPSFQIVLEGGSSAGTVGRGRSSTPIDFARQLLSHGGMTEIRVWTAFLKGANECIRNFNMRSKSHSLLAEDLVQVKSGIWRCVWKVFAHPDPDLDVHPDLNIFRHLVELLSSMVKESRSRIPVDRFGELTKSVFVRAIYGRPLATFLPSQTIPISTVPQPGDLLLLVRMLVSTHDTDGLAALVKWMDSHAAVLTPPDGQSHAESQVGRGRVRKSPALLHDVMCAVRLCLEGGEWTGSSGSAGDLAEDENGLRFETPLEVPPTTLNQVRALGDALGWPTDEQLRDFFLRERRWVERVASAARTTTSKRQRGLSEHGSTTSQK